MTQSFKSCPGCGMPAALESRFCSGCGHPFRTQFVAPETPPEMPELYEGPPAPYPTPQYPPYPQPYGPAPYTGKEKVPAGILAILLGPLGVHLFYLGQTGWGIAFLVFGLVTCGSGMILTSIVGVIHGILYLCANDYDFQQKYVIQKRFF